MGGGWLIQIQFSAAVLSCPVLSCTAPDCLHVQTNPTVSSWSPPPRLSCPAPLHTPCCRTAAAGPGVSACVRLPHCPCCPRCPGGRTGDTEWTGRGRGRWEAAGCEGGRRQSSGSRPLRRRDSPGRGLGSWK